MDGYTIHIMSNSSAKRNRTKRLVYIALMVALAVTLRLMKGAMFGPLQFINFPGVFTIVAGIIFGPSMAMIIGAGSYFLSDILIGLPGPWTPINVVVMGAVGLITGFMWKGRDRRNISRMAIGVGTYVIMFAFDIITSCLFYIVMGVEWHNAIIIGIMGLLMPSGGGYMYATGPITEAVTAVLVASIVHILLKSENI